jgi:NAD(P) transhydrogenase
VRTIVTRETHLIRSQFSRNRVGEIDGTGRFLDPHTVEITSPSGTTTTVRGDYILIACGTRPAQGPSIPIDGKRIPASRLPYNFLDESLDLHSPCD